MSCTSSWLIFVNRYWPHTLAAKKPLVSAVFDHGGREILSPADNRDPDGYESPRRPAVSAMAAVVGCAEGPTVFMGTIVVQACARVFDAVSLRICIWAVRLWHRQPRAGRGDCPVAGVMRGAGFELSRIDCGSVDAARRGAWESEPFRLVCSGPPRPAFLTPTPSMTQKALRRRGEERSLSVG